MLTAAPFRAAGRNIRSLGVAIPQRLLAERALDPAGDGVADPDDDAEQKNGKNKLKSRWSQNSLRYFASFTAKG